MFGEPVRCFCASHTDHARCLPNCACGNGASVTRRADGGAIELGASVSNVFRKSNKDARDPRVFRRG